MRETRRDYAHPYRPTPVAAINGAMDRVGLTRPLHAGRLIAAARRATGLYAFGDPPIFEPLERLVEALETEAHLTPVGRAMARARLSAILSQRLRAEALFERHPEILDAPVRPPLFITGLQRSGTTVLSRLVAADPDARALLSWEALDPIPSSDAARRRTAWLAEQTLRYLAPDFFAVHPVEADSPEEEVMLLDLTLISTVAEASFHVPSYADWVERQDQTPAYRYLERMLKLLQWQRDGGFWVLKSPHHLEWIETLVRVFPHAHLVQTHRDPVATIPSFCSMVSHGRGVFSDAVDPHEVGDHWLRKVARLLARAEQARAELGDADRFIDVDYADTMRDAAGELRRVYAHMGREIPRDLDARVDAWLQRNAQHRHGRHRYDMADFGLTPERIRTALDDARGARTHSGALP